MALDTTAGDVALNQLTALPLGYLMAEPLKAAVGAQALAAEATVDFIKSVGFENVDGKLNAIYLEFIFEDGGGTYRHIKAPLLMMVAIPTFAITNMSIQFKAKIDASARQSSSDSLQTNFSMGGSFSRTASNKGSLGISTKKVKVGASRDTSTTVNFYAGYSSKKDSKATQDSKYSVEYTLDISVQAEQAGLPQGLATLLNILQEGVSTKPLDTQVKVFGLSAVNKLSGGTALTDSSFFVLVLDPAGEPVTAAKVELAAAAGLIASPPPVTSGTQGVYTVPLSLSSGTTLTADATETLTISVTTGTSPNEEVTTVTREVTLAL
jgi:hypothetical protein